MKNLNNNNFINPYFSMLMTNMNFPENYINNQFKNPYLGLVSQNYFHNQLLLTPDSNNFLISSKLNDFKQNQEETSKCTDRETLEKSEKNSILEKSENREISSDNYVLSNPNNIIFDQPKNINNYGCINPSNYNLNLTNSQTNFELALKIIQETNNLNNVAMINEYFRNALFSISASNPIQNINFLNNINNMNNNYNINFLKNNISNIQNLNLLYNLNNFNTNLNNLNTISETEKSEEKYFVCMSEGCGKKFEYKWILEKHLALSHTGLKYFKCTSDNCNKAYKSRENLNLHIKNKHLGVKPYTCKFCNSKFSHRNGNYFIFL
jgi:Zinc finger, C2H2 type